MSESLKKKLVAVISYLYILLFVYAAVSKLLDFENFTVQLGQSPLLSAFAGWVAAGVPAIEIAISIMLAIPRWRLPGLYLGFGLMTMFTAYIYIILNHTSFIPCSCGGILEKMGWTEHLIFNLAFMGLALAGILAARRCRGFNSAAKSATKIMGVAVAGTAFVTGLFLWSERIIHKDNNFVRRYREAAYKIFEADLAYNSFYPAGANDAGVFIGNHTDPLRVLFWSGDKPPATRRIDMDLSTIMSGSVQLRTHNGEFILADGPNAAIYHGDLELLRVSATLRVPFRFSHIAPGGANTFFCRTSDTERGEPDLASINFKGRTGSKISHSLLTRQVDGFFDKDGTLCADPGQGRLIYLYRYRNQYIVADSSLAPLPPGRTIDTISRANITVAHVKSRNERKMSAPPLVVNKNAAVYKNLLFVQSALRGRYEPAEPLNQASVIDVYDHARREYVLSFYFYHFKGGKLRDFIVHDDRLYGFAGTHAICYELTEILTGHYRP